MQTNAQSDISNPSWDDFELINILGSGSYGIIYKVRRKGKHLSFLDKSELIDNKKVYVIKEIDTGSL